MSSRQKLYNDPIVKNAPRHNGVIEVSTLPKEYRDKILEYRRQGRLSTVQANILLKLDQHIYIHKYYPWSYENYIPALVLQGWYDVKAAKHAYLRVYGPKALKYVRFIQGKRAIEKGFKIVAHLYINNRWRPIPGKHSMFPRKFGMQRLKIKLTKIIPGATLAIKRRNLEQELKYYHAGSHEIIFSDKPIKTARLQKVRALKQQGATKLYVKLPTDER